MQRMQLSNTKMLFTSCCNKFLSRNGSTTQHLLKTNLLAYRTQSKMSNRSSSRLGTLRDKLSMQADKQLNCSLSETQFESKHYWKASSIDYKCKRQYTKHSNINTKQRFVIDRSTANNFKGDRKTVIKKQVFNQYSTSNNTETKLNNQSDDTVHDSEVNRNHHSKINLNSNLNSKQNSNENSLSVQQSNSSNQINLANQPAQQQTALVAQNSQNYTDLINVRSIYRNNLLNQSNQGNFTKMAGVPFKPKKALILTKFSRLEYERRRLVGFTEEEVKDSLTRRGSDYESLLNHHNIHTNSKEHVSKTLDEFGIEHRIVNRFEYNQEQIDWADVIITTGGDGTFLMAASKIFSRDKPVIGINSDPSRSVGYLCLQPTYSSNFKSALEKLSTGDFRWIYRQRIRVSVKGENAMDAPAELHDQQLLHPEFRYLDLETHPLNRRSNSPNRPDNFEYEYEYQVLPVRALNDVFVGECLSSRVSYFELQIEDLPFVKVKSSGVTICTGTGSTSWSFNINKISPQSVSTLFKIINDETNANLDASNEQLTKSITKKFNDSLIFDVCKNSMAYTVRDPVYMGNGFDSDNRGLAENIVIKSRMFDACVVIDGGLSYKFNDGAYAKFELLNEDQLKTVAF